MTDVTPTTGLGLRVWWAMTWRSLLLVMGSSLVVGLVIGAVFAIAGFEKNAAQLVAMLINLPITIYLSARVAQYLMVKGFGRYRLAVVLKQDETPVQLPAQPEGM